jgi:hypothetical protein
MAVRSRRREEAAMREQDVFVLAEAALVAVVEQIRDDQWEMDLPPGFATRRTDRTLSLRKVINYRRFRVLRG